MSANELGGSKRSIRFCAVLLLYTVRVPKTTLALSPVVESARQADSATNSSSAERPDDDWLDD